MATTVGMIRPTTTTENGWVSWVSTVDHKRLGILYLVTAFFFFGVGGIEALLIRLQLAGPDRTILTADQYNQVFTMHGTTMVFLAVMPIAVGMGNFLVPLQIGARDMAFPRLNALGYWLFLFGGIFLNISFLAGGAPSAGWFSYAPLTEKAFSPTHGMDYWVLALTLLGVSSIGGALNFIVTILNLRAPGMTINRMPLFVWMMLVTSFLIVFAFPSVTVATILLFFDRNMGTQFFNPAGGGDPQLWQHLFWFFGHPEVYIMVLPAFGMISEVLPTMSRKPIFGYNFVAWSGVAIGFLGFTVWAHHMFATGLTPLAQAAFSLGSMLIAVPTGVKIFNWIATLWGGSLNFKTPLYFGVGFIAMFIIGGISGVSLASPPVDLQQTDSYYVVAHIHYVLFGGAIFGFFAGIYYWFGKITGRMLSERIGKLHFWLMLIGFNLTFFIQHYLGTEGMPRRIYTYAADRGWNEGNLISSIGAFLIALSVLTFFFNVWWSLHHGEEAPEDPWDGATLEWTIPSPPPVHNFDVVPTVKSRRPFWDEKHPPEATGEGMRTPHVRPDPAKSSQEVQGIHLPNPSYYPIILAFGMMVLAFGLMYTPLLAAIGLVTMLFGVYGWANEPTGIEHA